MSAASFYKWRAKYGGMDASMVSRMKAIANENRHLQKMFAELSMLNELLMEALGQMAQGGGGEARGQHALSCRTFDVSETCYRYNERPNMGIDGSRPLRG